MFSAMKAALVFITAIGGASAFRTPLPGFRTLNAHGRLAPLHNTVLSIDERAPRDVGAMDAWATEFGVQKAGYQLTTEDGEDWNVVTDVDLAAGSSVLFVPKDMILSSTQVMQEYDENIADAEELLVNAGLGDQVNLFCLFVKILAEYEQGEESPYYPWLNSLPRQFNNGASMTDGCFQCLLPYVAYLAMKEKTNLDNFRKALQYVPLSQHTVNDEDLAKWAYNVAVTRSFDAGREKRIVPVADMFNHGTETEVDVSYDEGGNCMVYATRDVPAGSPLRMSYGDPTNPSPLFARYGFLDEASPATFCKLMNLKGEMQDLGMDFSKMLFYSNGDISDEVWDVLLYQVLASDRDLQAGFYQACMSGDADTKANYHQEYFQYTYAALRDHVDTTLQQLDELSSKARAKDINTHPRVPVILKHNEFVKNTFLTVRASLDAMA